MFALIFLDHYMIATHLSQLHMCKIKILGNVLIHFLSILCCIHYQLIYLKITSLLFPTSDFWHPVVTPAFIYMSQLLTKVCL